MPRRNARVSRRSTIRKYRDNHKTSRPRVAPIPVEDTVVPKGRCYIRSRQGKLKFTKEEVNTALRHAKHTRQLRGGKSTKTEARYYSCEDGRPEGCGYWHLTSLEKWEPKR